MLLAEHPFLSFLRDLPHRDEIQRLLAPIRAHSHLNANVWLYSVWFALTELGRLRRPEFKRLQAALHPWHERVYVALQQLRDILPAGDTVQTWVAAEVDMANQFEQQMLAQALTPVKKGRRNPPQQLLDASHNLVTYYKAARIPVDENIRSGTLKILRLLFPECTDTQITYNFDQATHAARLDDAGLMQLSLV